MFRGRFALGLGIALLSLAASDDKICWEKADQALSKSTATGKPVLWYFINNQFSKEAQAATTMAAGVTDGGLDKAFTNPVILKRKDHFIWVRGDQTLSNKFKVQGAPMVIFTDGDGEVIHKAPVANPETLFDAMEKVSKEKYVNVPVKWGDVVRTGPIKKKLLVVGFDDDKEGLKVLEDKTLVKYHATCEFVKLPFEKDGEQAKKWGITQVPSIVVCDAMERVLERLAGKKQPLEVKSTIVKAVRKLDDQDRKK